MTRTNITDRIAVIDGWIVDCNKNKLILKSECAKLITKSDFRRLCAIPVKTRDDILELKRTLYDLPASHEIFQLINQDEYKFCEMSNNTIVPHSSTVAQRNTRSIVATVTRSCHRLLPEVKNGVSRFLRGKCRLKQARCRLDFGKQGVCVFSIFKRRVK